MPGRLAEAGESQQLSGAVVALDVYQTHLSLGRWLALVEHIPRAPQSSFAHHPSGPCAFFKEEQRQSGPLHLLLFSPCSLAASFGKEMFCSQEVHCKSILHPRHKLLAA